jgi:hypothetical protein
MVDEQNRAQEGPSQPSESPHGDRPPGQGRREPEEHRIRARAHQIWTDEGRPDGRDKEHWLRARWELEREDGQA